MASLVSLAGPSIDLKVLTKPPIITRSTAPTMPYLIQGFKGFLSVMAAVTLTIEEQILDALSQHEFFNLMPDGVEGKRVYTTDTKHILEFIGQPANELTLSIAIKSNDMGSIQDLLRLAPAFCKAIDPAWDDAFKWVNAGLNHYEYNQEYLKESRNGYSIEFRPIPEINCVMVVAILNPLAPGKSTKG